MRTISKKNRALIATDPFYKQCARHAEGGCQGRITIDHSIIFAGRQLDEMWSLLPICAYHHAVDRFQDGGDLNKEVHRWIAINRATDDELRAISRAIPYIRERARLNSIYGPYRGPCAVPPPPPNITPSLFPLYSFA